MIEKILLVSDVDGVVREGVQSMADPDVILAMKELLQNGKVEILFISGTAVSTDFSLESWRRGNVSLSTVFENMFDEEMSKNQVAIYGVLGGQKLMADGRMEIVDVYPLDVSFELGKLLLEAFFKEVLEFGTPDQCKIAEELRTDLKSVILKDPNQSLVITPVEFTDIVETIRATLDPEFKLISNGALVETHTSSPPWETTLSVKWLRKELENPEHLISQLPTNEKNIAYGLCKRDKGGFHFLMISKMHKGMTIQKHIERHPGLENALLVTIGDTQVDYPMHETADVAFHVGLEKVWKTYPMEHCVMVRGLSGNDAQHMMGTLEVLNLLKEAVGRPIDELKQIFHKDSSGALNLYPKK